MPKIYDNIMLTIGSFGEPIPELIRRILELAAGIDLSFIRIHSNADAQRSAIMLSAAAYSVGHHIVMGPHAPSLHSREGLWLLAHEVAHVLQRDRFEPIREIELSDPENSWEEQANSFAYNVIDGSHSAAPGHWRSAPKSLVLRHLGPACPGPPDWAPIPAKAKADWLTANLMIENIYKADNSGHMVFFGSDFVGLGNRNLALPQGAQLSAVERQFAASLLEQLRGIQNQLQPDIVDFTDRAFYEIKALDTATQNPAAIAEQLESYYRLTDAVAIAAGVTPWNRDTPRWYPPHTLRFAHDINKLICTQATNYIVGQRATLTRPGIVLYQLLQRGLVDEDQKRAAALKIVDLAPELMPMRDSIEAQLHSQVQAATEDEYLIICSQEFIDAVIKPINQARMDAVLKRLGVQAMNPRQNPVVMLRLIGWTVIAVAEAFSVIAAVTYLTGGADLGAGASVAGGAGGAAAASAGTGAVVFKSIGLLGIAANDNAIALGGTAAAAGILFMIGTASVAQASPSNPKLDKIGMVIAAPISTVQSDGTLGTGTKVTFQGTDYFYLGKASARGSTGSTPSGG